MQPALRHGYSSTLFTVTSTKGIQLQGKAARSHLLAGRKTALDGLREIKPKVDQLLQAAG